MIEASHNDESSSSQRRYDVDDIILQNNPGNWRRKKAVAVDLTEFEQLYRELDENHFEKLL